MATFFDASIVLSETVCSSCKEKHNVHSVNPGNLNLLYDMKNVRSSEKIPQSLFTVKVNIKKIRIQEKDKGKYSAKASIEVRCPKCNQIHIIDDVMEIPRIVFEDIKRCDFCGEEMNYHPEEIEIEDKNGTPVVTASGFLRCNNCKNMTAFSSANASITENTAKEEWVITSGHSDPVII